MRYLFVVVLATVFFGVTAGYVSITTEYLGCFLDDEDRVLGAAKMKSDRMDLHECKQFCYSKVGLYIIV